MSFKGNNSTFGLIGGSTGGGGGSTQKQPQTFVVGLTSGAPVAGENTWTYPDFENSYIVLFVNGILATLINTGSGNFFTTKLLASDTVTIGNYITGWVNGDELTYILITP